MKDSSAKMVRAWWIYTRDVMNALHERPECENGAGMMNNARDIMPARAERCCVYITSYYWLI